MTDEFESLSPEQGELLVQLQDMTGLQDLGVCRALLESKDCDLDVVGREQLGQSDSYSTTKRRRLCGLPTAT